jgi:predicted mannosyl-3-phosphoglycerate phosphatase (HAD superfamily)
MGQKSRHPATGGEGRSGALVIFSRVEGLLRERTTGASGAVSDQMRFLSRQGVPLVFVSAWDACELRKLQDELAFEQPFICEEGAALHVPATWLHESAPATPRLERNIGWEVFQFSPSSVSAAFRLVSDVFVARGYDPLLTVGIGRDLADYALLREVDIPIVVRDLSESQPELVHQLPGVFVTQASGAAGWSEAVLGGAQ